MREGKKEGKFEMVGTVVAELGHYFFKVQLAENGHLVTAKPSGKMIINSIRTNVGDECLVEMDVMDINRGRIIRRL